MIFLFLNIKRWLLTYQFICWEYILSLNEIVKMCCFLFFSFEGFQFFGVGDGGCLFLSIISFKIMQIRQLFWMLFSFLALRYVCKIVMQSPMAATPNSNVVVIRLLRHVKVTLLVYPNLDDGERNNKGEHLRNDLKKDVYRWILRKPIVPKYDENNMK